MKDKQFVKHHSKILQRMFLIICFRQNPNMSVKSTNRPNNPENYKFEEDKLYLAQGKLNLELDNLHLLNEYPDISQADLFLDLVGKCLQESNGSFISWDQNQMMSARSR